MKATIEIVTICFADELKMLQMQARSIERHMDRNLLSVYHVIINDPAHAHECRRFIEQVIVAELGWLAPRVRIVMADELAEDLNGSGWLTQQALKLSAARLVRSRYFLILDAKNHFIAAVKSTTLFHGDQPRARVAVPTRNQRKWLDASLAYFGLGPEHGTGQVGATVTPYVMVTDICISLLAAIERRGDQVSALFATPEPRPSEFFLYYAHIQSSHRGYQHVYRCDLLAQATLFTKHPETDASFDAIMERTGHPDCWTFAIHRNRLPRLNPEQTFRVLDIWGRAGLIRKGEEDWFTTIYRTGDAAAATQGVQLPRGQRIGSIWSRLAERCRAHLRLDH